MRCLINSKGTGFKRSLVQKSTLGVTIDVTTLQENLTTFGIFIPMINQSVLVVVCIIVCINGFFLI